MGAFLKLLNLVENAEVLFDQVDFLSQLSPLDRLERVVLHLPLDLLKSHQQFMLGQLHETRGPLELKRFVALCVLKMRLKRSHHFVFFVFILRVNCALGNRGFDFPLLLSQLGLVPMVAK